MHGSGGEGWKQRRHMWPVHSNSTGVACKLSAPDFFLKDGRKVHIGDCALFKPPLDSPPFIGIIRTLKSDKGTNLRLDVNWLYRPADVKLPKGILLDAAPNEIFYSFHRDEIPAASLLHPCKVAFLGKGVELPTGISSFVCRRVYDTDHKCLWWLTDKDYINERQEEVDQLLEKTRLEMHGAVQSGGRSPKSLNGSLPALQPKSGSESVQNSSSLTSHVKSKKRERGDQGSEPTKRERFYKAEDGESGQFRPESMLKNEISKITDKGRLIDFHGVEKLVKLMQPDCSDKKIDLADRTMLADVIAVTDSSDCLGWFLQLKGLPVLDEWLQEVHKGKIGDGNGTKGSDKTVEDFLLALLRALDKLPVFLDALQTCNVGKSVNHLRTHKNSEIQKKARSLVDTWKKRVEAEMDVNDAKSESSHGVSWPSKSSPSEVSQAGSRKAAGAVDDVIKSSTPPAGFKHSQSKSSPTEVVAKLSAASNTMKCTLTMGVHPKDHNFRTVVGNSDHFLTPIKEERSSGSSQSQNNSQSSDHAKTVASSCREDTRCSNSGSGSVSKVSSGASRHRKSSNGLHLNTPSGISKLSGSGKQNATNKNSTFEKASIVSHEKSPDGLLGDHGHGRIVVRLQNSCRSSTGAARVASEDHVVSCNKGSVPDEVCDNHDKEVKCSSNVFNASFVSEAHSDRYHQKDEFLGSEEGKELASSNEECRNVEDNEMVEQSDTIASSTEIVPSSGKPYDASLSSINALIESCVKFSESNTSASPGDVVGMNLLASVATGEISKSNNGSPLGSPQERSPMAEESSPGNDDQLKISHEEIAKTRCDEVDATGAAGGCKSSEHPGNDNLLQDRFESRYPANHSSIDSSGDGKVVVFGCSQRSGGCSEASNLQQHMSPTSVSDMKPDVRACGTSLTACSSYSVKDGITETEGTNQVSDHNELGNSRVLKMQGNSVPDSSLEQGSQLHETKKADQTGERVTQNEMLVKLKTTTATLELARQVDEKTSALRGQTHREVSSGSAMEQKLSCVPEIHEISKKEKIETVARHPLDAGFRNEKVKLVNFEIHDNVVEKQSLNQGLLVPDQKDDCAEPNSDKKSCIDNCCDIDFMNEDSPSITPPDNEAVETLSCRELHVPEKDGNKKRVASEKASLPAVKSDTSVKLDFDLNEGCFVDDGTQEELIKPSDVGNLSAVQLPALPFFSIPPASGSLPVAITVASAAKGSVVPPENSFMNKAELGWKGSAATSAFRPAEPRKNHGMPLSLSDSLPVATTTSKPGRLPLDFDLNVADERVLEEATMSNAYKRVCLESGPSDHAVGLDLDLNKVDDGHDLGPFSLSKSRSEIPMSSRPLASGGLVNCGFNVSRNFDLNNGPCLDEAGTETMYLSQQNKSYLPFPSLVPGMRVNSAEVGNFSSWFPQGNSYSAITAIPSVLPGRGEQSYVPAAGSQRMFAPSTGTGFATEVYRAPVLSSSPAFPFAPADSFTYSGFPFETSFPLPSNTFTGCSTSYMDPSSGNSLSFPTIPSHMLGPPGVAPPSYPRPFIMSFPSGSNTVGAEIGKWGNQGLDLNAGQGIIDKEKMDERFSLALRQFSVPSSQPFADEQLKMFQVGGTLKGKEPDSGLDAADRHNYNQQ